MSDFWNRVTQFGPLAAVVDILIVAVVFYWLLGVVGGTRAVPVLRGLGVLVTVTILIGTLFQISSVELPVVEFLIQRAVLPSSVVAVLVIFQPEFRRALERLGTTTTLPARHSTSAMEEQQSIAQLLARAAAELALRRVGALLVIERETGLRDIADTGTQLDAGVSVELLLSIFMPGGPLHDGAVIISHGRIVAAGCVLPLSDNVRNGVPHGTRHRAALGMTETSDAVVLIVSEETGGISVAQNGRLLSHFTEDRLLRFLSSVLGGA